jgi:glucose-1-phosphate adenylyltransferase
VEESVILPDVRIGHGCKLRRTVIDKGCVLADGTTIGFDRAADAQRFHVTDGGVVLVTPDMLGQSLHAGE